MQWFKKWYVWLPFLLLIFILFYFFPNILVYLLISLVISLMGNPLMRFLDSIKIKKFRIPHSVSALISLTVVFAIILFSLLLLIPIIIDQAMYLSQVDITGIMQSMESQILNLETSLKDYGLLKDDESIEIILIEKSKEFLQSINIQGIASSMIGTIGNISIGVFSVIFLSYFFMRDDKLLFKGLKTFTPTESHDEIARILFYSKKMLSRYFIGLFLELVTVISIISLGMYIIGLKNAVLIGVIAGIFNIIPYLGPIIGGIIGCLIGLTTLTPEVFADQAGMLIIKMVIVFVSANLIDEFLLQPLIFSKSVKAHPIEIFIIILMAGTIAGPIGMILAIPTYTLLRIIAMEFFSNWDFVKNLTRNLNQELQKTKDKDNVPNKKL